MFRITALLVACLFAFGANAQTGKLRQAQQKMDNLEYMAAIDLYNQILENGDVAEAKMNLALAYHKVNDTPNAEFWYGQVVRLPESEPIHKLYYGMMLQRNGKCDIAREWYQQYVDLVPDDQRGQLLLRACDYEDELMSRSGIYEIKEVDFNSGTDDFSPQFYKNGLVFSSERDTNPIIRRVHAWTNSNFLELYYVDMRETSMEDGCGNYIFGRPEKFSNEINTKFHDAAVAFSHNGEEIFFTRNNFVDGKRSTDDDGIMRLKIFYARSEGEGEWGEVQSLPFNSNEYSVAHPTLSADGTKLYFTSDMPGGFGGMDLYISEKESGRWGPPVNLGPEVNTEGHEIFPHAAVDDKLYFSSDGQIGLGGLDIYYTMMDESGTWKTPENLGYPLNTLSDDFGIIYNVEGTCGFFSSDRDGGLGGDDIYSFKKTAIPVDVLVYDEKTEEPLEGALVYVTMMGDSLYTDMEGKVTFEMKLNDCTNLEASLENYLPNTEEACTENLTLMDKLEVKIPLKREAEFDLEGLVLNGLTKLPLEGATVTITNDCGEPLADPIITNTSGAFYFKLDRECCYTLKATKNGFFAGIVPDHNMTDNPLCTKEKDESETIVENLYLMPTVGDPDDIAQRPAGTPIDGETETGYTYLDPSTRIWMDEDTRLPADGEYPDGKKYNKGVLIDPNFPTAPTPRNYPEVDPENPDELGDPPVAKGPDDITPTTGSGDDGPIQIPYLLHIYYDFDQANLRDDAIPELEKLERLLQDNPQYIIEIGSHTDARGSYHYNNRLSQRRAQSVVNWLADRGVDKSRLVARGYGEKVNVNDCINNVPCSEGQHQMNRRTEFKVVGCRDCEEAEQVISKQNDNVRVDRCNTCPF